jgi:hypothetical protein
MLKRVECFCFALGFIVGNVDCMTCRIGYGSDAEKIKHGALGAVIASVPASWPRGWTLMVAGEV